MIVMLLAFPLKVQAQAITGAVAGATIAQFIGGLRDLVGDVEQSAASLLALGNTVAAQQQMLLAGILEQTIAQIEVAYADSLDRTIGALSIVEQNIFTNLQAQITGVQGIVDGSIEGVQDTIYQTQAAANQLLDRLPLVARYPVFYGARVGDLSPEEGDNPVDIEILGFFLSDPRLNRKPPIVTVDGVAMEASSLSIREDRIHVQVPQELKERLGVDNEACNPRRTFPITLTVFFAESRGWFIFARDVEVSAEFRANALVSPQRYDIEVSHEGTRSVRNWVERTFATNEQYLNVGCRSSNHASARHVVPEGARRIQCDASWNRISNLKAQNATCAVGGRTVTGTGTIVGRDTNLFGDCPGGGHAWFQLSGSYQEPQDSRQSVSSGPQEFLATAPISLSANLGIPSGLSDVTVAVTVRRHQCPEVFDRVDIPVSQPELRIEQASRNGRFTAVVQNGQMSIRE
jgi:hypothetical protein